MNSFLQQQSILKSQILEGRYVTYSKIETLLSDFDLMQVGTSVKGLPINALTIGNGPIRILMWSQMHGNEATSTKGIMDVMYFLKANAAFLAPFTIQLLPMLNPDGAAAYTRVNANGVDLNRDAKQQSQSETHALFEVYDAFQPDYCFNLHDQRTIFGVNGSPCILSYLSPAADANKLITESRKQAMGIIGHMNERLQQHLSNQVGRYDDTYNPNCVGDCFQSKGTPTILFECGQSGEDYDREVTRKWFSFSVVEALQCIANNSFKPSVYHSIPEVEKSYSDILIHNVPYQGAQISMALNYKEKLISNRIVFEPTLYSKGDLSRLNAHKIIDLNNLDGLSLNDLDDIAFIKKLSNMLDLTHYSH
ncbi:MAG: peptidase M14 [Flavobacteriaceae bacterium]|nr:peptidase M14 [Flavobacteriaceae bacterium]